MTPRSPLSLSRGGCGDPRNSSNSRSHHFPVMALLDLGVRQMTECARSELIYPRLLRHQFSQPHGQRYLRPSDPPHQLNASEAQERHISFPSYLRKVPHVADVVSNREDAGRCPGPRTGGRRRSSSSSHAGASFPSCRADPCELSIDLFLLTSSCRGTSPTTRSPRSTAPGPAGGSTPRYPPTRPPRAASAPMRPRRSPRRRPPPRGRAPRRASSGASATSSSLWRCSVP